MLPSYPSIYNLGHSAIKDLTKGPVIVEEKVDGSQFSFGINPTTGELECRSKGAPLHLDAPTAMFKAGVEHVKQLEEQLRLGWVYRGEYLGKPKHNTLAYNRVPRGHVILFDIQTGLEEYLGVTDKAKEAERLGLEVVPVIHVGVVEDVTMFRGFLERESILGGQKIEGVVIKPLNYDQFGTDKKCLLGKFVSEHFKEIHGGEWKKNNPTSRDIIDQIVQRFKTPARWDKAVQHLKEAGQLEDSPRDIGKLIKEVPVDVFKECEEEIAQMLWQWAWPHIQRGLTGGLPQWYKERLVEKQFDGEAAA